MSAPSDMHAAVLRALEVCECKAIHLRAQRDAGLHVSLGTLEDHRVEVFCELLDAIDGVHKGLGQRLLNAAHPLVDPAIAE